METGELLNPVYLIRKLREKLLSTETCNIPGTNTKHYGTVEVKQPQRKLKEN